MHIPEQIAVQDGAFAVIAQGELPFNIKITGAKVSFPKQPASTGVINRIIIENKGKKVLDCVDVSVKDSDDLLQACKRSPPISLETGNIKYLAVGTNFTSDECIILKVDLSGYLS